MYNLVLAGYVLVSLSITFAMIVVGLGFLEEWNQKRGR